jgi:hypothetical protein
LLLFLLSATSRANGESRIVFQSDSVLLADPEMFNVPLTLPVADNRVDDKMRKSRPKGLPTFEKEKFLFPSEAEEVEERSERQPYVIGSRGDVMRNHLLSGTSGSVGEGLIIGYDRDPEGQFRVAGYGSNLGRKYNDLYYANSFSGYQRGLRLRPMSTIEHKPYGYRGFGTLRDPYLDSMRYFGMRDGVDPHMMLESGMLGGGHHRPFMSRQHGYGHRGFLYPHLMGNHLSHRYMPGYERYAMGGNRFQHAISYIKR